MHILLIGIQGSGKGTQARQILETHKEFQVFEMGQKLREFAEGSEPLSATVKNYLEQGALVPLEVIETILKHYADTRTSTSTIFDGIPRTHEQLDMFDRVFPDYVVFYLDLGQEEALKRLASRRIDPSNGQSFPREFVGDYSPYTGQKLVRRDDDHEEAIKTRLASFYTNTLPLIAECKRRGKLVYQINADQPIENVTAMINMIISAHKKM